MAKQIRSKFDTRLSFSEICRRSGINARQRLVLIRYFKEKMNKSLKEVKSKDDD